MVIMCMSMKNTLNFIYINTYSIQGKGNIGACIDQKYFSLITNNAGHAWPVYIPTVSLTRMCDGEVITFKVMVFKFVGSLVSFIMTQVQIYF